MGNNQVVTAPAVVDVLAVIRDGAIACAAGGYEPQAIDLQDTAARIAELIAADREVDEIEDAIRRAALAGPRPNSYGTGWEVRDEASRKYRERRHEEAHARRAAALARIGGAR